MLNEDFAEVATCLKKLVAWNVHEGRFGKCYCDKCKARLEPKLAEAKQKVAEDVLFFDHMLRHTYGEALAAQTCCLYFLWLTDLISHPLVDLAAFRGLYDAWPLEVAELPDSLAKSLYGASLPRLQCDVLQDAIERTQGGDNAYLHMYISHCQRTAAELLGQTKACGCPSIQGLNTYTSESLTLRRTYAWSIPSEAALEAMSRLSPLLEVGCGSGYWASLLRARGADILCYNSGSWSSEYNDRERGVLQQCGVDQKVFGEVFEGGVEAVRRHAERTLVLMWPDYAGHGSFGLKCLEEYEGEYLVLVGEWEEAVAAVYDEECVLRLPNWPLFLDCVMVLKRKSLDALIEAESRKEEPPDILSAFFSGAHDPFAALGLEDDFGADEADETHDADIC